MLVLERADGGDLFTRHRALPGCRMPELEAATAVLAPLLRALAFLHGRGTVHRDIKVRGHRSTWAGGWGLCICRAALPIFTVCARTHTSTH